VEEVVNTKLGKKPFFPKTAEINPLSKEKEESG
jgi:hypothetical protein